VEGQLRLEKLDFWLRSPDFLADEVLNDYERRRAETAGLRGTDP
jgi:hypothetical protein